MPFFRVGGGEREYPKHNPQKMVQVVLDVMIAAIPAQLPQPQEAISPENSKPRFQSKRKKTGGEEANRGQNSVWEAGQRLGRGTGEGLEGHGSSRPTDRASRIFRERKGCHQGLKKLTATPDLWSWALPAQGPLQFSAAPNICLHDRPQARPLDLQARSQLHIRKPPSIQGEQVSGLLLHLPGPREILTCPPDLYESRSNSWAGPNPVARLPPSFSQIGGGCGASRGRKKPSVVLQSVARGNPRCHRVAPV